MSHGAPRGALALSLRSLLAALWFAAMFFVAGPLLVLRASGAPLAPPPGLPLAAGIALIALAHALLLPLVIAFVREGRGTHAPFDPPRTLVRSLFYRRTRNPMYLLYVVVVAGEALAWRSLALAAYAAAFALLVHVFVVYVEEPGLRRRFGAAYAAYCAEVPRWLLRSSLPLDVRRSDSTTRNSRGIL